MSLFSWWEKENGPGSMVSVNGDPSKVEGAKIEPPKPDLSTCPASQVVFVFGWACAEKHVSDPFVSSLEKLVDETRLCPTCGLLPLRKAVVKRTKHAEWARETYSALLNYAVYEWSFRWSIFWDEFVHFVDDKKPRPRRRRKK